jgi:hypothetical protein
MEKVVMSRTTTSIHLRAVALSVLTFLSACAGGGAPAGPTFAQVAPQVPPDRARIFFYRADDPYGNQARPDITLNGKVAGVSEPDGVFYRDVLPGEYRVAVSHDPLYPNEDKTISLAGSSTAFVRIESLQSSNGNNTYDPNTFVVVVVGPADGQREIASKRYFANGS